MKDGNIPDYRRLLIAFLGFIVFAIAGCSPPYAMDDDRQFLAGVVPTVAEIASTSYPKNTATVTAAHESAPLETASPSPTRTPYPATAVQQPATATSLPTVSPTPLPTMKPVPVMEPVDRSCPDPVPLKPEYDRFFLSAERWPAPEPDLAQVHFWLSKPLPGAGRTLINQRFPYGWDENGRLLLHNGVDIAEELGTPVLAVADGRVVVAQTDIDAWYGWRCDWYGHLVVLELDQTWHDQPIYVLYGHVLNIRVDVGQRVERGEPVAEVGFGGAATHPHLHFEVRIGTNEFASTRNPMLWLDPGPTRGVIAGRLVDPEGRPWQGVPLALVSSDGENSKHSTWSYLGDPQHLSNPDVGWAENFVFSDVKPGDYDIYTTIQGVAYRQPVTVSAGQVAVVEIETESLKVPTPDAEATGYPGTTAETG